MIDGQTTPFTVEIFRGRSAGDGDDEVLSFLTGPAGVPVDEAPLRVPEVVCLQRAGAGIAAVSLARPADVPLIGGRRFWLYLGLPAGAPPERQIELIGATFHALQEEFDGAPGAPLGLCVLIDDPEVRRLRPEAQWIDPPLTYAGYLADGRQVRIAYFERAEIAAR